MRVLRTTGFPSLSLNLGLRELDDSGCPQIGFITPTGRFHQNQYKHEGTAPNVACAPLGR